MYLVVIHDKIINSHTAVAFDTMDGVQVVLATHNPGLRFDTLVFKLNPESDIYTEIFPEVLDYEQE